MKYKSMVEENAFVSNLMEAEKMADSAPCPWNPFCIPW